MQNTNPCIGCGNAPNCTDRCSEWDVVEQNQKQEIFVIEPGTITEEDLAQLKNEPGEIEVMEVYTRELSYETGKEDGRAEMLEAQTASEDPTPSFEEVFEAFDRWYWDKYRHHPPRMESGAFYEFLKLNGIVK